MSRPTADVLDRRDLLDSILVFHDPFDVPLNSSRNQGRALICGSSQLRVDVGSPREDFFDSVLAAGEDVRAKRRGLLCDPDADHKIGSTSNPTGHEKVGLSGLRVCVADLDASGCETIDLITGSELPFKVASPREHKRTVDDARTRVASSSNLDDGDTLQDLLDLLRSVHIFLVPVAELSVVTRSPTPHFSLVRECERVCISTGHLDDLVTSKAF